jgi:hypothetical protein
MIPKWLFHALLFSNVSMYKLRGLVVRVTTLGEFSPIGQLITWTSFSKITEAIIRSSPNSRGHFFPRKNLCINFNNKWLHFGRFFSQTHLVTLLVVVDFQTHLIPKSELHGGRVTWLGELLPLGRLLTLRFLVSKIEEVTKTFWETFWHGQSYVVILKGNGLGS